jgi:hypothetical protein
VLFPAAEFGCLLWQIFGGDRDIGAAGDDLTGSNVQEYSTRILLVVSV